MNIEEKYKELMSIPSDVNLNFPLIRKSVEKGDTVVELGVRSCVSTWALLAGGPSELVSVDVNRPPEKNIQEVIEATKAAGIKYHFVQHDSTSIAFTPFDVLFIDTLHLYSHIVKELWKHAEQVNKRIIFHDSKIPEVRSCIQDFLFSPNWKLEKEETTCNGLVVLKRLLRP